MKRSKLNRTERQRLEAELEDLAIACLDRESFICRPPTATTYQELEDAKVIVEKNRRRMREIRQLLSDR